MNPQAQQSKLLGLQKDLNLLITIAQSTSMDTHAERVLFLGLDLAINNTLDAIHKQLQEMCPLLVLKHKRWLIEEEIQTWLDDIKINQNKFGSLK